MKNPITLPKLGWLLSFNLLGVIMLGVCLLLTLQKAEKEYVSVKKTEVKTEQNQAPVPDANKPLSKRDSIVADSLIKVKKAQETKEKETPGKGVTFYLIVLLMLISGALGGILCNLRGFFIHFRSEDEGFPANLEVPYYVRPFMGAGAGIFIYFVANFLITSITMEYLATNIPFQGMVSFVALAMLAGFGSLEFFQRLKETALTLFGQKAEKDRWQRLEDLYALFKKGLLTEAEYNAEKTELLANSSDLESFRLTQSKPK